MALLFGLSIGQLGLCFVGMYVVSVTAVVAFVIHGRRKLHWIEKAVMAHPKAELWSGFVHNEDGPTSRDCVVMFLVGLTLPIRFAVMLFWFFLYWALLRITLRGISIDPGVDRPLPRKCINAVHYIGRVCATGVITAMGVWRVRFTGKPLPPLNEIGRYTMVSNHNGYIDILLLMATIMPAFVSKMEVASVPGVGFMCESICGLFIDRRPTAKGQADVIANRQRRMAEDPLLYPPLLIFPEGTTTNGTCLLRFKRGAFIAGTPLLPILIRLDTSPTWLVEHPFHPHWEAITFPLSMLSILLSPSVSVTIEVLDPYFPSEQEKAQPDLLTENVEKLMREKCKVSTGKATFQDKLELFEFLKTLEKSARISKAEGNKLD